MDVELKLLNLIIENEKINQRAIAKEVGVSLGTINSMLRNLEEQKYLTIHKTAHNSAVYVLSEAGKNHRCKMLYEYLIECSEMVTGVRTNIRNLLLALSSQGIRKFYLSESEDEFYRIVMLILMEISRKSDISYHLTVPDEIPEDGLILGWQADNVYRSHKRYVHLINKI